MNPVGVIIVDYQSDPLLANALNASSSIKFPRFNVVIVENNPKGLRVNIPKNLDVEFLCSEENLGFGRAVNWDRRHLKTPYFLLLNPDVILFQETLSLLYRYMEKWMDVGLAVPNLLEVNGALQLSSS
jgi:GT2 family glycosyltransferase